MTEPRTHLWIDEQSALDRLVGSLEGQPGLAIDCEMDSMFAYRTSLCLVQVGWPGCEALIDGQADLDRSGLGDLFADANVVKVFHGGENDIGLMRTQWGLDFENIFDSMAASQVLGHDGVGLAATLERHFGVKVSKKYQKADWRIRPLPEDQAEYARLDVRFLLALREKLSVELAELRREEEAATEFDRIRRAEIEAKPFESEGWVRVKGARRLAPERRGLLRALFIARDEIARDRNWAPYRVFQESTLLTLMEREPTDVDRVRNVRGLSRDLREHEFERLASAVRDGLASEPIDLPRPGKPWRPTQSAGGALSPEQQSLYDALRRWRSRRAEKRGVDVARVATNVLLGAIARVAPRTPEALAAVDGIEPWRLREYGDDLLAVVARASS